MNEKTVLTFGVFDMLHIGHILLFKRAKACGDRLIVAVQEDSVIRKYKPDTRIIYSTEERLFMVGSVRYVDETVTYRDVDADIASIDFDLLVLGPDQTHDGFQRAMQWCREHGKEIVVLPRTEGISSSLLRSYSRDK